jgi:hypothetical protein
LFSSCNVTAIKLSDLVPSPLREKVRMRGDFKKACFLFPHPSPLPQGEGVSFLNLMAVILQLANDVMYWQSLVVF